MIRPLRGNAARVAGLARGFEVDDLWFCFGRRGLYPINVCNANQNNIACSVRLGGVFLSLTRSRSGGQFGCSEIRIVIDCVERLPRWQRTA